jgi:tRNA threonylcarbamoyladenosine biosynthesis protein TsaB
LICLGIDTALGACSVALIDGDAVLAHAFQPMTAGHAEALAPMAEAVMAEASRPFRDVARIAVTTGPGTFTGQRIGLAFARGLALALKIPCVGVTTLEAMARAVNETRPGRTCLIASDARRGEAYVQSFGSDGLAQSQPALLRLDDVAGLAAALGPFALLAGSAAPAIARDHEVVPITQPDALWVARIAILLPAGDEPPAPLYLRAPDAKLPGPLKPLPGPRMRNA